MIYRKSRRTNRHLSWWGPLLNIDNVVLYQCPLNLTADSSFNASSHCPVNSFGDPLDFTADSTTVYSSSEYTTVD